MNGASVTPKGLDQFRSLTWGLLRCFYVTQQLQPRRCHLPRPLHRAAAEAMAPAIKPRRAVSVWVIWPAAGGLLLPGALVQRFRLVFQERSHDIGRTLAALE